MQNQEQLEKVYQSANNSAGSAKTEQEAYMNSISGKLNTFKETVKATWLSLSDTGGIKSLLSGTTDLVGGLNNIVKTFGAMPTVIMSVVGAMTIFNTKFRESMSIYQPTFMTNWIKGLNGLKTSMAQSILSTQNHVKATQRLINIQNLNGTATLGAKAKLAGYQAQLAITTIGTKALQVATMAMQMAFSMGIALAISLVISKIMDLTNAQENLKKSNEETIANYNSEKESLASTTQLLAEKKKVEEQLSSTNEGTKENKELKEKLLEIERQLATALPSTVTGYDEQGKALSKNNKLIEEQIKLKQQASQDETMKQLSKNNTFFDDDIESIKNIQATLEQYKQSKIDIENQINDAVNQGEAPSAILKKSSQDVTQTISEMESKIASTRSLILQAVDAGKSYKDIADYLGTTEDAIKSYTQDLEDNTDKQKQNSNQSAQVVDKAKLVAQAMNELKSSSESVSADSIEKLNQAYPDMKINADNATESVKQLNTEIANTQADDRAKEISNASDAYAKSAEEISKVQGFLDKLNKAQAVTPAIAGEVLKVYPELATQLGSVSALQDGLNSKIKEQQASQSESYLSMMSDDEIFYQNKIANSDEYKNAYNNLLNGFITDGQDAYSIDFGNYKTLNELKKGTQDDFGVAINSWLGQFVDTSAEGYGIDLSNFASIASAKAEILRQLQAEVDKVNKQMASATEYAQKYNDILTSGDFNDPNSATQYEASARASGAEIQADSLKNKLGELNGAYEEVNTKFDQFGASMQGFSGDLGGASDFSGTGSGGKDTSEADAKKAQTELIASEKETITKITDAYDEGKSQIEDDISEIDGSISMLGDADNSNFTKRIELTNQKLLEQGKISALAGDNLTELQGVTVTTEEAQKALATAIQKASKEANTERLEMFKLSQELQKALLAQEQLVLEKQKEIDTTTLETTQAEQTKQLEEYTEAFEKAHQDKLDALDAEEQALEDANTALEDANTLQEKKNTLAEKEEELANLKSQKTVKTLKQGTDGTWSYVGEADSEAIKSKQTEVDDAETDLADTKREQELAAEKQAIEDQKTAETELYTQKKALLDSYSDDLKEQQDLETQRLEQSYSDMEELSKTRLKELSEQYGENWDTIASTIATKLTETTDKFNAMTTIKLNFGDDGLASALSGGSDLDTLNSYLIANKDKINQAVKLDLEGMTTKLNTMKTSATELSKTYEDVLAIKDKNTITATDLSTRTTQVATIATIDNTGLATQLANLKTTDALIDTEKETHYTNELARQNKAQQAELLSLQNFEKVFLLQTNSFLELLQVLYDFRFSNIVTVADGAGSLIGQALSAWEVAYEKFAKIWNSMNDEDHQIQSKITIKDALSSLGEVHTSVVQWTADKSKLYTAETFEQYASTIGEGISDTLLSKLSNYSTSSATTSSTSSSSTVTDKSTTSTSTTSVVINGVTVNADNAETFLTSLLAQANQTSALTST